MKNVLFSAILSACFVVLSSGPANAILYTAHLCTNDTPCTVAPGPHGSPAPLGALDGLTSSAFVSFYSAHGYSPAPDAGAWWRVLGTNINGYAFGIGGVAGLGFDAAFLYHAGTIVCCTLDIFSFRIADLNDSNLLISQNLQSGSFRSAGETGFPLPMPIELDAAGQQVLPNPLYYYLSYFLAIDNNNSILLNGPGKLTQLDQVYYAPGSSVSSVPEPASALVFFPMLLLLRRARPQRGH